MEIKQNQLTASEFIELWNSVWNDAPSLEQVELALSHTVFSVSVYENGEVIGMARMLGDMGMCYYIKDVAVKPEYQHRGIGLMLMNELEAFIADNGIKGSYVFIELAAEPKNIAFYERFGFSYNEEKRLMKMKKI